MRFEEFFCGLFLTSRTKTKIHRSTKKDLAVAGRGQMSGRSSPWFFHNSLIFNGKVKKAGMCCFMPLRVDKVVLFWNDSDGKINALAKAVHV